jgi:hypothetical protein
MEAALPGHARISRDASINARSRFIIAKYDQKKFEKDLKALYGQSSANADIFSGLTVLSQNSVNATGPRSSSQENILLPFDSILQSEFSNVPPILNQASVPDLGSAVTEPSGFFFISSRSSEPGTNKPRLNQQKSLYESFDFL